MSLNPNAPSFIFKAKPQAQPQPEEDDELYAPQYDFNGEEVFEAGVDDGEASDVTYSSSDSDALAQAIADYEAMNEILEEHDVDIDEYYDGMRVEGDNAIVALDNEYNHIESTASDFLILSDDEETVVEDCDDDEMIPIQKLPCRYGIDCRRNRLVCKFSHPDDPVHVHVAVPAFAPVAQDDVPVAPQVAPAPAQAAAVHAPAQDTVQAAQAVLADDQTAATVAPAAAPVAPVTPAPSHAHAARVFDDTTPLKLALSKTQKQLLAWKTANPGDQHMHYYDDAIKILIAINTAKVQAAAVCGFTKEQFKAKQDEQSPVKGRGRT